MKKPLILIIILAVLVLVIVFFRSKQAVGPTSGNQAPTQTVVQPPVFPSAAASQPTYTISVPTPTFPDSLPVFDAGGPTVLFAPKFVNLANLLGFFGQAKIIVGSRGNFSVWNQGASSLTLGGDPLEIAYNSGMVAGSQITKPTASLEQTARAFIQKLNLVPSAATLVRESVDYFAPDGNVLNSLPGQQGATLVQFNFRYLLNDRPLFVRRANAPGLSVRINNSGQIISLSGFWFPGLSQKNGSVRLLGYQAATQKLTNNQGVLTSLSSTADFNTESVFQYAVSQSTISGVTLGYYYHTGNAILTPIYLFNGSSVDDNTGKTVSTVSLVSALP